MSSSNSDKYLNFPQSGGRIRRAGHRLFCIIKSSSLNSNLTAPALASPVRRLLRADPTEEEQTAHIFLNDRQSMIYAST